MIAMQRTLDGDLEVAGLTWLQRQLVQIMEAEPETVNDEDLLIATWLYTRRFWEVDLGTLREICSYFRRYDPGRRREELVPLYPYSPEEMARRQKRAKGGPP